MVKLERKCKVCGHMWNCELKEGSDCNEGHCREVCISCYIKEYNIVKQGVLNDIVKRRCFMHEDNNYIIASVI